MAAAAAAGFAGSVLVACGPNVLFARDYGFTVPAGWTPSYWVASISKQYTAAAALLLRERGKLQLDQTVAHYFPDAPAVIGGATLMQLATHQSGLKQVYAADGVTDRAEAARRILSGELNAPPGAHFLYSNDNYSLIAMIIEMVSGESFESFVGREVFQRAGLREAGFWPDDTGAFLPPIMAPLTGPAHRPNWGFRGGTGLRCSVPDLHRWALALDAGRVLNAESLALLYGPHLHSSDGTGVGFAWFHTTENGRDLLWTRGYEDFGANAILYRVAGSPFMVAAATHAGPPENQSPGWSRVARDVILTAFPGRNPCG